MAAFHGSAVGNPQVMKKGNKINQGRAGGRMRTEYTLVSGGFPRFLVHVYIIEDSPGL